jgi:hypothetical protein
VVVHNPGLAEDKPGKVVHNSGLEQDRAFAAGEEVIPQVVEAEPRMAPFVRKRLPDLAEMDRIHPAAEQFAQYMVLHIVGNMFRQELKPLHNYGRFDTGYS